MSKPVGSITVNGERMTLNTSGEWSGDASLAEYLNERFNPQDYEKSCDAVIPFGYATISAAAKKLGDTSPVLPSFPPSGGSDGEMIH